MNKKARGSALIVAFLLIAAVGGTALSIGRLFLMDQSISQLYEDSIVSYYAAESGIEEGLLRYRYDKNVEVPIVSGAYDKDQVSRNNLTTNASANVYPRSAILNPNQIRYELNIASFGMSYSNKPTSNLPTVADYVTVPKDESIKIDVTDAIKVPIKIWVNLDGGGAATSFIEAKLVGKVGGALQEDKIALVFQNPADLSMFAADTFKVLTPNGGYYYRDDLKSAFRNSTWVYDDTSLVELTLKPIGLTKESLSLALSVQTGGIAMPNTIVNSTGHYGRNSRTLTAKIDRQSGTVYDLFDYVVYDRK